MKNRATTLESSAEPRQGASVAAAPCAPTRADVKASVARVLHAGRLFNADVLLVRIQNQDWTVKDFGGRPWPIRATIGRWMIAREMAALTRLAGIEGVPGRAARVDGHALCYAFIDG